MHLYLNKLKNDKSLHLFKHFIDFNFRTETNIAFMIEILLDITDHYLEKLDDTDYHLFYLMLLPILLEDIRKELKDMGKSDTIIETIHSSMECCDFLDNDLNVKELIKDKRLKIYKLVFT